MTESTSYGYTIGMAKMRSRMLVWWFADEIGSEKVSTSVAPCGQNALSKLPIT